MKETHFSASMLCAVAITVMVFPGLSKTQDATTSSMTATVSSAISTTTANPSQNAWILPISGPGDDPASAWGVNMTVGNNRSPKLVPIIIGNSTQHGTSDGSSSSTGVLSDAKPATGSKEHPSLEVTLGDVENPALILGLNAAVGSSDSSTLLPATPFGLNIGRAGEWNGSLILGGEYDANRIYGQNHWSTVPEANDTRNTFLANGQLALDSVRVVIWEYPSDPDLPELRYYPFGDSKSSPLSYTGPALLDFSNDSFVFPTKDLCGKNITLDFNVNVDDENYDAFMIPVFADLTKPPRRCLEDDHIGPNELPMILGLPFFQSVYLFVNEDAQMFFSGVIEWDLPAKPEPFYPSQTLEINGPTSPTSAPKPTSSHSEGGKVQATRVLVAIISMAMAFFFLL